MIYPIKYRIERGEFTKEELLEQDAGGCEQIGVISVMGDYGNGEAVSTKFLGLKGNGAEWDDSMWLEVFGLMASNLKECQSINPVARDIAREAFEKFKALKITGRRKDDFYPLTDI